MPPAEQLVFMSAEGPGCRDDIDSRGRWCISENCRLDHIDSPAHRLQPWVMAGTRTPPPALVFTCFAGNFLIQLRDANFVRGVAVRWHSAVL
jgi:hypothetical protein